MINPVIAVEQEVAVNGKSQRNLTNAILELPCGEPGPQGAATLGPASQNWGYRFCSQALAQDISAIIQSNEDALLKALQLLRLSIEDITRTLGQMYGGFLGKDHWVHKGSACDQGSEPFCLSGQGCTYPHDGSSALPLFRGKLTAHAIRCSVFGNFVLLCLLWLW